MLTWFLRRFAQALVVILLMSVFTFALLRSIPGDPARLQLGILAEEDQVEYLRHALGLDRSIAYQYWVWLQGALHGDLGVSFASPTPVTRMLMDAAPATLQLTLVSFLVIAVLGIGLGVRSALHPRGRFDQATRGFSIVASAIPDFVFGMLGVLIFGWLWVGVIPYQGYVPILQDPADGLLHSILPTIVLAFGPMMHLARMVRSAMLETLNSEYVSVAISLGVPRREVVWRDTLRNAILPILTVLGLILGNIFSATLIVENIFGIPGLGRQLVGAFGGRDYPVVLGVVLVYGVAFILVNLLTDFLYGVLSPRVRSQYAR